MYRDINENNYIVDRERARMVGLLYGKQMYSLAMKIIKSSANEFVNKYDDYLAILDNQVAKDGDSHE